MECWRRSRALKDLPGPSYGLFGILPEVRRGDIHRRASSLNCPSWANGRSGLGAYPPSGAVCGLHQTVCLALGALYMARECQADRTTPMASLCFGPVFLLVLARPTFCHVFCARQPVFLA